MNYTKQELIESLQKLAKELGKSPTSQECNSCSYTANVSTYRERFGSWMKAKEEAGLETANKFSSKTTEELIYSLKSFYEQHGRPPVQKECRIANGLYGPNTYKDRFGGWEKALEAAGLRKNNLRSTQVSDSELLESLKRFYKEEGRAPRHEDCNDLRKYSYLKSHMVYKRRFGTFTDAIQLAGVPLNSSMSSAVEIELAKDIQKFYVGEIQANRRDILEEGLEIDLYFPELSLGIEVNGLYWHSESRKDKKYHLNKLLMAESKGIELIQIFENELYLKAKRKIVLSRIRSKLGLCKKIYARNCQIQEISSKVADKFLNNNHIQGTVPASVRLGLFHEDTLVAVQTFSKSRITKTAEWELLRYCSLLDCSIVGGASKLFKYFVNKITPVSVVSYADRRWSNGAMYENLGFELSHCSAPNYWYFKGRRLESRIKYQKHKLADLLDIFDPQKTEVENMRLNGYDRIFDCGNKVFVYTNNIDYQIKNSC